MRKAEEGNARAAATLGSSVCVFRHVCAFHLWVCVCVGGSVDVVVVVAVTDERARVCASPFLTYPYSWGGSRFCCPSNASSRQHIFFVFFLKLSSLCPCVSLSLSIPAFYASLRAASSLGATFLCCVTAFPLPHSSCRSWLDVCVLVCVCRFVLIAPFPYLNSLFPRFASIAFRKCFIIISYTAQRHQGPSTTTCVCLPMVFFSSSCCLSLVIEEALPRVFYLFSVPSCFPH